MDRIADLAGASKRTVYNHFPSKEDLFKAVLDKAVAEAMALKQIRYDSEASLEAQLGAFADAKLALLQNSSWIGMLRVSVGVFLARPDLAKDMIERAGSEENTLVTWLEAAQKDGRVMFENAQLTAHAFWSMISGAFLWPMLFHSSMSTEHNELVKEELIQMFLARYRA